jgi:hypothetical protein
MPTTTASDIVQAALKEINVLAAGETMSAEDGSDGLAALNLLVDEWSAQRLQIYQLTRTTWTIVSGNSVYTVGTGGTVDRARPVYIQEVRFQDTAPTPDLEYPLYELTDLDFANIPQKALTNTLPTSWHYNPTFPLGTLTFWPVPTSATLQGVMYAPTAVTEFAALTDALSLPPGYKRMMIKGLAMDLAGSYGREVSQSLREDALESLADVKRANARMADLSFDTAALTQGTPYWWNIKVGP